MAGSDKSLMGIISIYYLHLILLCYGKITAERFFFSHTVMSIKSRRVNVNCCTFTYGRKKIEFSLNIDRTRGKKYIIIVPILDCGRVQHILISDRR